MITEDRTVGNDGIEEGWIAKKRRDGREERRCEKREKRRIWKRVLSSLVRRKGEGWRELV